METAALQTDSFDFRSFRVSGVSFAKRLFDELRELGIDTSTLRPDHLCFRVGSELEFAFYREQLELEGELLTESIVNGRPICTFRLFSPFLVAGKPIQLLELPAPKPGTFYETGFEHIEFVIDESFERFSGRFPHLSFASGSRKIVNNELILQAKAGTAKFHHLSLERVIELEKAKVTDVVFDFDGTIIKSREQIYEINRIVFSNILEREVAFEESIANFHPEFSKLFDAFLVSCPVKRSKAISMWGEIAEAFSYDIFDGVSELLRQLYDSQKLRLHLWTARDERSARKILSAHSLQSLFTTLSFADSINSKPHGNSLKFDWRSASRNSVLVIGDSPSDVFGAKNIGAIPGAAMWDHHAGLQSLVASGAELYFSAPSDVARWLNV